MLDPLLLAQPMVQALETCGSAGQFQMHAQGLGWSMSLSVGGDGSAPASSPAAVSSAAPAASSTSAPAAFPAPGASGTSPAASPLSLGLPHDMLPDISSVTQALQQAAATLVHSANAATSALSTVAQSWTGEAAMQAAKHVEEVSRQSLELAANHETLAVSTDKAAEIVTAAASEIAGEIAAFLTASTHALSTMNIVTTPLTILVSAVEALANIVQILVQTHSQLAAPTSQASELVPPALAISADGHVNPLSTLPSARGLLTGVGSAALGALPTAEASFRGAGIDAVASLAPGQLPHGHISWGEDYLSHPQQTAPAETTSAGTVTAPAASPSSAVTIEAPTPQPAPALQTSGLGTATAPQPYGTAPVYTSAPGTWSGTPASPYAGTTAGPSASPSASPTTNLNASPASTSTGYSPNVSSARGASDTTIGNTQEDDTVIASMDAREDLAITLPDGSLTYAPNSIAAEAIRAALSQIGVPYVWGGTTPGVGLDCSGLTQWAYQEAGVEIGRTTWDQDDNPMIDPAEALPGDLLIWDGHVAMFLGNGVMIEAGDPVSITPVRTDNAGMAFEGVFRPWLKAVAS